MKFTRFTLILLLPALAFLLLGLSCKEHTTELLTLDDPEINPAGGNYNSGQAITITHNEIGASVYYTVNGNDPTQQDSLLFTVTTTAYSGQLIIPNFFPAGANAATLKVRVFKQGMNPSNVLSNTYTVTYYQTVETPVFYPPAGNITTAMEISIVSPTAGSDIHYTLDGSDPTQASPLYEDPFTISQTGAVTVKARAYKNFYNPSEIGSISYNVTAK